jgi:hypothetical protein
MNVSPTSRGITPRGRLVGSSDLHVLSRPVLTRLDAWFWSPISPVHDIPSRGGIRDQSR